MIDHDELVLAGGEPDPALLELTEQITERLQAGEKSMSATTSSATPMGRRDSRAAADHARSRRLWPGRRPRPPASTTTTSQTKRCRQSQTVNRRRSSLDP